MDVINRNKRNGRHLGKVVDVVNVCMAVIILVAAVLLVVNIKKNMIMFSVIFICSAIMNISLGVKVQKQRESLHSVILYVFGIIMMALAALAFFVAV